MSINFASTSVIITIIWHKTGTEVTWVTIYSRTSIIRPTIIRNSGLSEPKACPIPTLNSDGTTCSVDDNIMIFTTDTNFVFQAFDKAAIHRKPLTLLFSVIVSIREGLMHAHYTATIFSEHAPNCVS